MPGKKGPKAKLSLPAGVYVFGFVFSTFAAQIGISGYDEWQTAKAQVEQNGKRQIAIESQRASGVLKQWIESNRGPIKALALASDVKGMQPENVATYVKSVAENQKLIDFFAVMQPSGDQIARSDTKKFVNLSDRTYFKKAMEGNDSFYEFLVSKTTGHISLMVGVPIRGIEPAQAAAAEAVAPAPQPVVGAVQSTTDLETHTDTIFPSFGKTGRTLLVDDTGKILYARDLADAKGSDSLKAWASQDSSAPRMFHGTAVLAHKTEIDPRYSAISVIDEAEVMAPLAAVESDLLRRLGLGFAAASVLALIIGNSASRSIRSIANVVDRASKAGTVLEIAMIEDELSKGGRISEISVLSRSVKRLMSSIKIALKSNI